MTGDVQTGDSVANDEEGVGDCPEVLGGGLGEVSDCGEKNEGGGGNLKNVGEVGATGEYGVPQTLLFHICRWRR